MSMAELVAIAALVVVGALAAFGLAFVVLLTQVILGIVEGNDE